MSFVNRRDELTRLERWWAGADSGSIGIVWGRRRVGKTELIRQFARNRRTVFHIGARRAPVDELAVLSAEARPILAGGFRDLATRPFADWTDLFETLAAEAASEPLLLVLDEFPELVATTPELPSVLRAVWERVRTRTRLRILLSGSAVRTMEAIQEQREPLYGRIDLTLLLHPFRPHEAAELLTGLAPADRAVVWSLVGGMPQYLTWWDQSLSISENLLRLAVTPGGRLLAEGDLIMATEGGATDLASQVLYAIAGGRTKFGEIQDAVKTDPSRTLERLRSLRLIDRLTPVTDDDRQNRRRTYQIADNFLSFWLGILSKHRSQIDLGLGTTILPVILAELDEFIGPRWEEAFRLHLRRLAEQGDLGPDVVAIGPNWTLADERGSQNEIDAVVLAGRERAAVLVGEAKWARHVDGGRIRRELERKALSLPRVRDELVYAVAARERVEGDRVRTFTASDIFD